MPYNAGAMREGPGTLVEYGTLQRSLSPLFLDYVKRQGRIAPFFGGGNWGPAALDAVAPAARAFPRDRAALARILERQQRDRGAERAAQKAARLGDPETTAILTGQQPGLFGGPLFVLYKALGAMAVASLMETRLGTSVVPVFWVASDDHDFAEIRSTTLIDEGGFIRTVRYQPAEEPLGKPASQVLLDASIGGLLDEVATALPSGLHREEVMAQLRAAYRPGVSFSRAFGSFLSSILPDLVVLDSSDPELKALMVPVLSREIEEDSPTSRLALEVGDRLLREGYHQQVPVRPGLLNLFLVAEGERRALGVAGSEVEIRGLGRHLPKAQALADLRRDPSPWSPGVLLRPLAEDFILPTLGYMGGPAEIAYHAQIGPSYAHFGIPRPVVLPRPSLTLVEPQHWRTLASEGLELADLEGELESLLNRKAREANPEIDGAFAAVRRSTEEGMGRVGRAVSGVDPTLGGASDATLGRLLHQIDSLREKATRALKKRDVVRAEKLRRTRDGLFPGGAPQERGLGLVSLLGTQGLAVAGEILERIDPFAEAHQVISL
jgi:bacillithiol biosynthesis cysteine-adding enzyme BshC